MILTLEKTDPKVKEFREKVYTDDIGIPLSYMDYTYTELKKELGEVLDEETFENAWKMSNTKFEQEDIDKVWLIPNIGISCGIIHDEKRYRVGYLTYTLKEKRAKHRSLNWKEFGFVTWQACRAIELGKSEIIVTVYEYNKKMSAQVRMYKNPVYSIRAGNAVPVELEYRGVECIRNVDQHVFAINFETLYKKYDPLLMELKNNETSKIISKYPTAVDNYPDVVELKCDIDLEKLIKEYNEYDSKENYLLSRRKDFVLSPSLNIIISSYLGFRETVYDSRPLNKKGSIELKDEIGEETKRLLNEFSGAERVNYVTTKTGWKTKQHVDHEDYTEQGFRVIIPLNGAMKMTFEDRPYVLTPGKAYFVNVCIPHVGEHYDEKPERASILFKLNSDELIWKNL